MSIDSKISDFRSTLGLYSLIQRHYDIKSVISRRNVTTSRPSPILLALAAFATVLVRDHEVVAVAPLGPTTLVAASHIEVTESAGVNDQNEDGDDRNEPAGGNDKKGTGEGREGCISHLIVRKNPQKEEKQQFYTVSQPGAMED